MWEQVHRWHGDLVSPQASPATPAQEGATAPLSSARHSLLVKKEGKHRSQPLLGPQLLQGECALLGRVLDSHQDVSGDDRVNALGGKKRPSSSRSGKRMGIRNALAPYDGVPGPLPRKILSQLSSPRSCASWQNSQTSRVRRRLRFDSSQTKMKQRGTSSFPHRGFSHFPISPVSFSSLRMLTEVSPSPGPSGPLALEVSFGFRSTRG